MELIGFYFDMLNGNCCCLCLSEFYESDGRTIKSNGKPTICDECLSKCDLQFRRMWFGVIPVSYKYQKAINATGKIPVKEKLVRKVHGLKVFVREEIKIPKRFLPLTQS